MQRSSSYNRYTHDSIYRKSKCRNFKLTLVYLPTDLASALCFSCSKINLLFTDNLITMQIYDCR